VRPTFPTPLSLFVSWGQTKKGDDEEEDVGVTVILQQSVTSTFSLKYLLNFTKSAPLAKRVTLHMSDEIPMLVS